MFSRRSFFVYNCADGAAAAGAGRSFNSEDNPTALLLTEDALGSRFFGGMPQAVVASLQTGELAMENHQAGAWVPRLGRSIYLELLLVYLVPRRLPT